MSRGRVTGLATHAEGDIPSRCEASTDATTPSAADVLDDVQFGNQDGGPCPPAAGGRTLRETLGVVKVGTTGAGEGQVVRVGDGAALMTA